MKKTMSFFLSFIMIVLIMLSPISANAASSYTTLKNYIINSGSSNQVIYNQGDYKGYLNYYSNDDEILYTFDDGEDFRIQISIKSNVPSYYSVSASYFFSDGDIALGSASVNPKTYNSNTVVSFSVYSGYSSLNSTLSELFNTELHIALTLLNKMLNKAKLTLGDFGFSNYWKSDEYVTSIAVYSMPIKTVYNIGESFNSEGLALLVYYLDGTNAIITNSYTVSGFNSQSTGTKQITVKYNNSSCSLNISVVNNPVNTTEISILKLPQKTSYEIGEQFNSSGLELLVKYSDGSQKTITSGFSCYGFDSTSSGNKTITVNYDGKSTYFTITVKSKQFLLTYNANGGYNTPASQITSGQVKLSEITPYKYGSVFLGWSTDKNSTIAQYKPNDNITVSADITLYAIYKPLNLSDIIINSPSDVTIDYYTRVVVKADARNIPDEYRLGIFDDEECLAVSTSNSSITYDFGTLKEDKTISIKVVDENRSPIKENGQEISKSFNISVNRSFLRRLIAFFKILLGTIPAVTLTP